MSPGSSPKGRRGPIRLPIEIGTASGLGFFRVAVTLLTGGRTRKKFAKTATPGFFKRNTLQPLPAPRQGGPRCSRSAGGASRACDGAPPLPLVPPAWLLRHKPGTGQREQERGPAEKDREGCGGDWGIGAAIIRTNLKHHREIRSGTAEERAADPRAGRSGSVQHGGAQPGWFGASGRSAQGPTDSECCILFDRQRVHSSGSQVSPAAAPRQAEVVAGTGSRGLIEMRLAHLRSLPPGAAERGLPQPGNPGRDSTMTDLGTSLRNGHLGRWKRVDL